MHILSAIPLERVEHDNDIVSKRLERFTSFSVST